MKLPVLVLLIAATSALAQPATVDQTARFLAGMPVDGPLAPLMQTQAWQEHAAAMDDAWNKKDQKQIAPISAFMESNARNFYYSTNTCYYMFSGPDILYPKIFYPRANTYILAGLEPLGQLPDLTRMPPEVLGHELAALRASMSSILRFQYFITKDMRAELGAGHISGTIPILCVFLARLGCTVQDVAHLSSPAEGVKITCSNGGRSQTVFYFRTDLSGGGSNFLKWCAQHGPGLSLLKAASYLMHTDGFSGVRNFLLANSRVIIQDDSGIPLRAFPKDWRIDYYGRYVPSDEFKKYWQPALAAVYQNNPPAELGFPFGYHWQPDQGILMVATREGAPRATPVAPAQAEGTPRPKKHRHSPGGQ